MSLNLEIPIRTRYASCNSSIESIQTRIEKHFESSGTANENAVREQNTDTPLTKHITSLPQRRPTLKQMNSVHQVEIKPSTRVKMLSFGEELKRRQTKNQKKADTIFPLSLTGVKAFLKTDNKIKSNSAYVEHAKENRPDEAVEKEPATEDIEEKLFSEEGETLDANEQEDPVDEKCSTYFDSQPVVAEVTQTWQGKEWSLWKTVTNVHPQHDTQVPHGPNDTEEECENTERSVKVLHRLPLLSNKHMLDTIQQKLALKKIRLPPLCACGHDTSVFDANYSDKCCVNCQLYKDKKQHERLLRTMLKSFKLL